MKPTKWILIALIVMILIVAVEGGSSFMSNHSYYRDMITSGKNQLLILAMLGCAGLPLYYLYDQQKPRFTSLMLWTGGGLGLFSLLHGLINGTLLNLFAGATAMIYTLVLFGLGVGILGCFLCFGDMIARGCKLFTQHSWQNLILSFGIGLVAFLVVGQFLMGFGIFYSRVIWLIVAVIGVVSRLQHKQLAPHLTTLESVLAKLHQLLQKPGAWIFMVLILLSFGYVFFGFNHAMIPYPTAWDANHEYLYIPKVIAENHGILRGNEGPANGMPYLWHGFIAFAFSLWQPLTAVLPISADTFAVTTNFFSGILVLLLGLGIFTEGIKLFGNVEGKENEQKNLTSLAF